MIFNHEKFVNATRKIHIKPEEIPTYESIPDSAVRKKLDEFIDYDKNPRFSAALDEICENIVGRTMFKVLMTKLSLQHKTMRICEHNDPKEGSRYKDNAVYINLSFYEVSGVGVPSRQYYYIDEKHQISTKLKSLAGSIFHEFCHGLHHVSKTRKKSGIYLLCVSEALQYVWGKDEELRTITCVDGDPICDHCFDFYQSILEKQPFRPRYSHGGWRGDDDSEKRSDLLLRLPQSQKYMDGWREYMV
jgi:hypothetical protein